MIASLRASVSLHSSRRLWTGSVSSSRAAQGFSTVAPTPKGPDNPPRHTTTTPPQIATPAKPPLSNRKQFLQIPVNTKILQYIVDHQLSKPVKQSQRRKLDRTARAKGHMVASPASAVRRVRPPPLPFGPTANPVRVRRQVRADDPNLAATWETHNPKGIPTVALCGRSNVGKSTLLNALLYGNKTLPSADPAEDDDDKKSRSRRRRPPVPMPRGVKAAMSPKPGETRDITFYELSATKQDDQRSYLLWLADLPGYGFAHASPEAAEGYQNLLRTFLSHETQQPRRVLLLLDARHGLKQTDRLFLQQLQRHVDQLPPLQIVLTKCDLVDATDLARRYTQVQHAVDDELRRQPSSGALPVLLTSATRQNGILAVQRELANLVSRKT